jgi:dUTP pyrophosphatase
MVAEDIVVPSYQYLMDNLRYQETTGYYLKDLNDMAMLSKKSEAKPTLVPTGIKCYLEPNTYLELSVRSSCPLKHWLFLANSVGIIDADYVDNADNEGHIYFQMINLSPFPILLRKGDIIGQGIIKPYLITDDDAAEGTRTGGFGSTSK